MYLEAATNTVHHSGEVEEFEWSPNSSDGEDEGVIVTYSSKDYVETSRSKQPGFYKHLFLGESAIIPAPVGVLASATIATQTSHGLADFSVVGELSLEASIPDDLDPKQGEVVGSAEAKWGMMVSIRQASIVQIENCDLFSQRLMTQYPDFQREAGNCSFRIDGSPNIEFPDMPGLPKITIDPTTVEFDDEQVESKRPLDSFAGQVVDFNLRAYTEMTSFSPSGAEGVRKENFAIHIRRDIDAQPDK
jgi:hypothetical protein